VKVHASGLPALVSLWSLPIIGFALRGYLLALFMSMLGLIVVQNDLMLGGELLLDRAANRRNPETKIIPPA